MLNCLVVDDSKVVRKIARGMIEPMGFAVDEAADGQQALDKCLMLMPDFILLDWNMPVMDGLEFLKKLRASPGGDAPKVMFCTTAADMDHIIMGMQAGANEYVMKPFNEDIIRDKMTQIGLL